MQENSTSSVKIEQNEEQKPQNLAPNTKQNEVTNDGNQISEIKQIIQRFISFVNSGYEGNARVVKSLWFVLSLFLENLLAFNLFEYSVLSLTLPEHKSTVVALLNPFKQLATQNKFIRRSKFPAVSKDSIPIPIIQLIIVGQIFFKDIESFDSFLKALRLFSRSAISERQVLEWCSNLLPEFSKFMYYSIIEERKESLDPAFIYKYFNALPPKVKTLVFSPTLEKSFQNYQEESTISIYEDLLAYSQAPPDDRLSQLKLEITEVRSSAFYTAYVDNLTFTDTPTKAMISVSNSLYRSEQQNLFGSNIFGERCKQVGQKEHLIYLEQFRNHLANLSPFDAEYRSSYIKMHSCKTQELTLFYNGFKAEITPEFGVILDNLAEFGENVEGITEEINRIKLFKDEKFYSSVRYASVYMLMSQLQNLLRENVSTILPKLVSAMKTEQPPFASFGECEIANADVIVMGIMKSIKHFNDRYEKYGAACRNLKSRMFAKVIIESNTVSISLVENLIVENNK